MSNPSFEKELSQKPKAKPLNGYSSLNNGLSSHPARADSPQPDIVMQDEGASEPEAKPKQKQSTASSQSPVSKDAPMAKGRPKNGVKKAEKQKSGEDSAMKGRPRKKSPLQSQEYSQEENKDKEKSSERGQIINKDICNICKDGGDLICCDNCPRSFHLHHFHLKEEDLPPGEWYCERCLPQIEKKNEVERLKKLKLEDKIRKQEEKKQKQEQAKQAREQAVERKREEKMKQKMLKEEEKRKLKEQSAQEVRNKLQQQTFNIKENKLELGLLMEGSHHEESKELDHLMRQAKQDSAGPKKKRQEEKNEQERAREERAAQVKKLFKVFADTYPELVEKNSIKYPIEDLLIQKVPNLHGAENQPPKPEPRRVLIDGASFERLLYVWEFANNFQDYLDLAPFKIEELQCALSLQNPDELFQDEEEKELSWEQQQTIRVIKEEGFELLNKLFVALLETFWDDKDSDKKQGDQKEGLKEDIDPLFEAINNHIKNHEQVWPELIRLLILLKNDYNPSEEVQALCIKLSRTLPSTFSTNFSYDEKLSVLELLIDLVHEQDAFRNFLNVRMEEKSNFNKQKMEVQAEIKALEAQKLELLKEHANSDQAAENEQKIKEIEELKDKLRLASRIEARKISEKINVLQAEKNKVLREKDKIEEQIVKKQQKIEKLNEQGHKLSIKTQILGKDSEKSEYWYFKEDQGKVFVKKVEQRVQPEMEVDEGEELQIHLHPLEEPQFKWFYYDEEDHFNSLVDACNPKGVRERKLQDNLKRIAERMKLKKSRQKKDEDQDSAMPSNNENSHSSAMEVVQIDTSSNINDHQNNNNQHFVFENDNYYNALQNAVWFGKKLPPRRQGIVLRRGPQTSQPQGQVSLDKVKDILLQIEESWMNLGGQLSREWAIKEKRDQVRDRVLQSESEREIADLMLEMDVGFSDPNALKFKEKESDNEDDDEGDNIRRTKIQFFKYWPSKTLKQRWRNFLAKEIQDGSLSGLFLAVQILQMVNEQYVKRQIENLEKKNKKGHKLAQQVPVAQGKRTGNRTKDFDFSQYFQSSSSEDESSEEEEKKKPGRKRKVIEEDDSDAESDEDESSDEDVCFVCGKGGKVLICEGCNAVAHLQCVQLKKVPSGDWHCQDCLQKMTQRRTTRNQVQLQNQRQQRAAGRQ